jgi:hypothetical protein
MALGWNLASVINESAVEVLDNGEENPVVRNLPDTI